MKYLKTYETKFGQFGGELKKYLIIKDYMVKNKPSYLRLYRIDNDNYTCSLLQKHDYITNRTVSKLDNDVYDRIINSIDYDDKIEFQSNNLDDTLEHFDLMLNTKKYNL